MVEEEDLETLAVSTIRCAGLDPSEPQNPAELARRLGIRVLKAEWAGMRSTAVLARVRDEQRIYVRPGLRAVDAAFATAHELGHFLLAGGDEGSADRLAAALIAPRRGFVAVARTYGAKFSRLARWAATTESCAALRFGEVTGEPIVLITPQYERRRGWWWTWPSGDELRSKKRIPGIVRARLRDDPERVVVRRAG